jgi:hypothetical protein
VLVRETSVSERKEADKNERQGKRKQTTRSHESRTGR